MDADRVFRALLDECNSTDSYDLCPMFAEYLEEHNWFVAEDEDDLHDLALEHTDLIEPE